MSCKVVEVFNSISLHLLQYRWLRSLRRKCAVARLLVLRV